MGTEDGKHSFTVRTANGRCVTVKDMAALFGQAAGAEFVPSRNGKTLVTKKNFHGAPDRKRKLPAVVWSCEDPERGEEVSGDNYMFRNTPQGRLL